MYSSNNLRPGIKIIMDSEPYEIEYSEFVKPGKGQAFVRVKLRRIFTGAYIEKTFKSTDFVESANIIDMSLTYLYNDGEFWFFMNKKTFEQLIADAKVVGNSAKWLLDQSDCMVTLWNDQPIVIIPPNFVELKVINTNPGLKGDTVGTSSKLATLSTGAIVKVPLFIQVGDMIKVDTRSSEYVSRVK